MDKVLGEGKVRERKEMKGGTKGKGEVEDNRVEVEREIGESREV